MGAGGDKLIRVGVKKKEDTWGIFFFGFNISICLIILWTFWLTLFFDFFGWWKGRLGGGGLSGED